MSYSRSKPRIVDTIVSLFDFHQDTKFVPLICDFIDDINPTVVVHGGDYGNYDAVSDFTKSKEQAKLAGKTLEWEDNYIHSYIVNPILKAASARTMHVFLQGNHEYRLDAFANTEGVHGRYYAAESMVRRWFEGSVFEYYTMNVPYRPIENLMYFHGLFWTKYHAARTVDAVHKTCIYGHVHDIQTYTTTSPIDVSEYMYAKSAGCLCEMNPDYRKNRPNRWVNAFNIAYIRNDGTFNDYNIVIVKGGFSYAGKTYGK